MEDYNLTHYKYRFGMNNLKKVGKWMSLYHTVSYKWVTVMDGVKFEF